MYLFFLIQKCEYEHKITSTWKRSQVQYLMTVFINSPWFNIIVIACNRDCVSKKTNSDHIIAEAQQGPWKPQLLFVYHWLHIQRERPGHWPLRARKGETGEPLILWSCVHDWCNAHPKQLRIHYWCPYWQSILSIIQKYSRI